VRYQDFVHAWVLDMPGCASGAATEEGLAEALALSAAEHRSWLARHGVIVEPEPFEVVEDVDGRLLGDTGGEFSFESDRGVLTAGDLERLLRLAARATEELVEAAARLPAEVLDWEPPESTLTHEPDPWSPGIRTAREVLRHALQLEVYYRGGLGAGAAPGIFEPVAAPLEEAARTQERLRAAFLGGGGSTWVTRPGRSAAEEWTIRKVVRRLVAHHRTHAAEIDQRRTWVLLGAPTVARGQASHL
jgi:hypothetical protein